MLQNILIACLKLMDDVSHSADAEGDSLPTEGVEIVNFNVVILYTFYCANMFAFNRSKTSLLFFAFLEFGCFDIYKLFDMFRLLFFSSTLIIMTYFLNDFVYIKYSIF